MTNYYLTNKLSSIPFMAPQNRVFKKQPPKDGRNAKQRRKDEKRAARLSSGKHMRLFIQILNSAALPTEGSS